MALWSAVLGHGNLIYHGAGWQEGGLTVSFEKLVQDVEMIQHMIAFLAPVPTESADLALDALGRVKPGGHFFGDAHTLERYASAFYQPMLSDWRNHESWIEAGGADATERATLIWKKALKEYEQPPMDEGIAGALDAYVAKRKEEIGAGALILFFAPFLKRIFTLLLHKNSIYVIEQSVNKRSVTALLLKGF
jgi:trimethylamine--corrinoid protein Co-methyltransferase